MMTPRPLARTRRAAIALGIAATGLVSLAGCDPRAILFFLQPNDPMHPPDAPSLRGKKVAIISHATAEAQGAVRSADHEVTREFVKILRENVKHVEVVEPQKVWDWADAHPSWTDPAEVGRAFEADMVIFLEIEQFQIEDPTSPGLFQGSSKVHVQITELKYPTNKGKELKDKPKEGEAIFDTIVATEFPNRGPMPMEAGVSRSGFQSKFIKLVATEISWHFLGRGFGDDIQDTKIY